MVCMTVKQGCECGIREGRSENKDQSSSSMRNVLRKQKAVVLNPVNRWQGGSPAMLGLDS